MPVHVHTQVRRLRPTQGEPKQGRQHWHLITVPVLRCSRPRRSALRSAHPNQQASGSADLSKCAGTRDDRLTFPAVCGTPSACPYASLRACRHTLIRALADSSTCLYATLCTCLYTSCLNKCAYAYLLCMCPHRPVGIHSCARIHALVHRYDDYDAHRSRGAKAKP